MEAQIINLIEDIKADYARWHGAVLEAGKSEVKERMIREFNEGISYTVGQKYIKIVKSGSVWGFIVNTDTDKKFKKGDILKPASWATPARNAARGNILEGGYKINWTGPLYLK